MSVLARLGRWMRDGWLAIGIALALFGLLEGTLSLARWLERAASGKADQGDWRIGADAYPDRSWVPEYYREFRESDAVYWRPYVYWRRGPYHARYINVDTSGIRQTVVLEPRGSSPAPPIRILMLGGSALWGTGARDAYTIPSLLATELARRGLEPHVVNFGESGYVSTQELIALLLELERGERPDVVIFYDGVNDVYSAYQQPTAGLPQNEFKRVAEFNLLADLPRRRRTVIQDMARGLATVRLLQSIVGRRRETPAGDSPGPRPSGQDILRVYAGNLDALEALSGRYHFRWLSYWQPTIFDKKRLTAYEAAERRKARTFEPFFVDAYGVVRRSELTAGPAPRLHDLSLLFADVIQPVFIDWVHIGEWGNGIVAHRMAEDVVALLARKHE